jgi:hypothetical protein
MNLIKKGFKILAASCLLLFFLSFLPEKSLGFSYSPSLNNLKIEAVVLEDGSIKVEQDMEFNSSSNYLFWIIPSSKADNIVIKQNGQIVLPSKVQKESQRTIVFWQQSSGYEYSTSSSSYLSYSLPPNVELRGEKELINLILIREPGQNINNLTVSLSYPDSFKNVGQRYYAIHGIDSARLLSGKTPSSFGYQANNISEYGIFSLDLVTPKGTFNLSWFDRTSLFIGSLSLEVILMISFILPLLTLFFLFSLYRNHIYTKDIAEARGVTSFPPSNLSPLMVDVIRNGKLTARGIGAELFSLLNKGYLTVVEKPGSIKLGKIKEPDQKLSKPEKILIRILFKRKELKGGLSEIEKKKKKSLFDKLTGDLFNYVNQKIKEEEYFIGDTSQIKNRVLKQAILIFFVAVLLAIFLLVFFPSSPWLSIAPISMTIVSLLIIRLRHFFTVRSPKGQDELADWLKFKNYLKKDHPIKRADKSIFLNYLPWAYLFSASQSWTRKFNRYPVSCPNWFISSKHGEPIEDQISKTTELLDRISKEIVGLKSPLS